MRRFLKRGFLSFLFDHQVARIHAPTIEKQEKQLLEVFLCFSSEPVEKGKYGPLGLTATTPLGLRNSLKNIIEVG
jgi:hypothetical protein